MAYTKQTWKNGSDGGTPLSAARLNNMESGIKTADETANAKQEKGDPGKDGDAATVSVGTVSSVASSASPTVTNSGTTSAATLDFEIPKGEQGPAGSDGTDGNKGDAGTDGSDGRGVKSVSGEKSNNDFVITFKMTSGGDETVTITDLFAK